MNRLHLFLSHPAIEPELLEKCLREEFPGAIVLVDDARDEDGTMSADHNADYDFEAGMVRIRAILGEMLDQVPEPVVAPDTMGIEPMRLLTLHPYRDGVPEFALSLGVNLEGDWCGHGPALWPERRVTREQLINALLGGIPVVDGYSGPFVSEPCERDSQGFVKAVPVYCSWVDGVAYAPGIGASRWLAREAAVAKLG